MNKDLSLGVWVNQTLTFPPTGPSIILLLLSLFFSVIHTNPPACSPPIHHHIYSSWVSPPLSSFIQPRSVHVQWNLGITNKTHLGVFIVGCLPPRCSHSCQIRHVFLLHAKARPFQTYWWQNNIGWNGRVGGKAHKGPSGTLGWEGVVCRVSRWWKSKADKLPGSWKG